MVVARAIVLAEGCLGEDLGKTANGLVLHAVKDEIVGVIDSTKAGRDAGEVVSGRRNGIPVVATFDEAYRRFRPSAIYLGAATVGGVLPPWFDATVRQSLEHGFVVYNGLHKFLGQDPVYSALAKRHGANLVDVREPPKDLRVADGRVFDVRVPRVLVMGTDCSVGKRMTAVEILKEARRRGIDAGFVATGQTGCMIGPDAGAVIDRVPSDFCAGQVEKMVCDVAATGKELVIVYGQASILHPAYSGVSLSILHGAAPHAIVLQTDPVRTRRTMFKHREYTIGPLTEEIDLIERLGTGKVVAIAVNGKDSEDISADCARLTEVTGLPAADPLHDSAAPLLDAVLGHLSRQDLLAVKANVR